jgi:tetratricopeptide (TPR) repeat protein
LPEAETLFQRALAIDEASYGEDHPTVAGDFADLGRLMIAFCREEEAEEFLRKALAIDESFFGNDHPIIARRLADLAEVMRIIGRRSDAEKLLQRGIRISLPPAVNRRNPLSIFKSVMFNYIALLEEQGLSGEAVQTELVAVMVPILRDYINSRMALGQEDDHD